MNTPRGLLAWHVVAGSVLAAGGLTLPADCKPPAFPATDTAELYSPAVDRWTNMCLPRFALAVRIEAGLDGQERPGHVRDRGAFVVGRVVGTMVV